MNGRCLELIQLYLDLDIYLFAGWSRELSLAPNPPLVTRAVMAAGKRPPRVSEPATSLWINRPQGMNPA